MNNNKKICIVGGYSFSNYGDEITYFSLYSYLKNIGYEVKMLSWPKTYKRYFRGYAYPSIMWNPRKKPLLFNDNPYANDLIDILKYRSDLIKLNDEYDVFIVGSGQYFNARVLNNTRYYTLLDWVRFDKQKIAYSAAWGNGEYPVKCVEEKEKIKECIKRFDYFSVREQQSVDVVKKQFGLDVNQVIDPVFLCEKTGFSHIAKKPINVEKKEKYVYSYMLDSSSQNGNAIRMFSQKQDLKLISVCAESMNKKSKCQKTWETNIEQNVSVEEWLWYIENCSIMITDSFHGMCMALVFNKPFVVITRPLAGVDRYSSLLGRLNLMDHIIEDPEQLNKFEIERWAVDYEEVNEILKHFSDESKEWLNEAIESSNNIKSQKQNLVFEDASFLDVQKHKIHKLVNIIREKV